MQLWYLELSRRKHLPIHVQNFLKKGTYHTHALFSDSIFLGFLMPTMINLVVFNHSPKFESNYSKYKKDTRFRIKIRIKRNHYLSLDSVQMIN